MIYHITSGIAWSAAQKNGAYTADSLTAEGFIHCSKLDQVLRVADTWYTGKTGLLLLEIDEARLGSEVRWEPGTDKPDEKFPHVYGPLNLDSVTGIYEFKPGPDGHFTLPPSLTR
jgi:uncharacterized protein (DUF952 family)